MRVTTAGMDESVAPMATAVEIVTGNEPPSRPRRGRPPGAKGSQIRRVKQRLALLVVSAKSVREIAKAFSVTERTVRTWLRDPEVQAEIGVLEQELRERTEHQLLRLFGKSIRAAERLLDGRVPTKGYARSAVRLIEMVWVALGRIPPKGARIICNHATPGTPHRWQRGMYPAPPPLNSQQYDEMRRMIRAERERMEREAAEKSEQCARRAE